MVVLAIVSVALLVVAAIALGAVAWELADRIDVMGNRLDTHRDRIDRHGERLTALAVELAALDCRPDRELAADLFREAADALRPPAVAEAVTE